MESTKTRKSHRRKYDAVFKQEVLKMVEMGRSVSDIAQSLGIGENLVYYWRSQARSKTAKGKEEIGYVYSDQQASLHKRIKMLEMERDILKKALGIFSRQS